VERESLMCASLMCGRAISQKKKRIKGEEVFLIKEKKEWKVQGCELIIKEKDGMIMSEIKTEEKRLKIVSVHMKHKKVRI